MIKTSGGASPFWVLMALLTVQFLFGINYVISKIVVEAFPPLMWASFRIVVSAIVLFGIAYIFRRDKMPKGKDFYVPLIVFALLGTVINQGCFLVGLKYTTSTNSAILNTLIPVFTLLVVTIRGQEALTWRRGLGFFSALFGVLVIRKIEDFHLSNETFIGDMLMVVNCFSYALFLSYSKKLFEKYDRLWSTAWLFVYGSIGLTIIGVPDWINFKVPELTNLLLACAAFAIIGGTLVNYFLNNWALSYTRSSHVALFIYIQPIFASVLAWWWRDEAITTRIAFSYILILTGMLLALENEKKTPKVSTATDAKQRVKKSPRVKKK